MKHLLNILFAASMTLAVVPAAAAPAPASTLVSRAEAVKAVVESSSVLSARLTHFRTHLPPLPLYVDVPQQNQLAPYLEAAFEQGIITGNADRLFRPTEPITVEELTVLHARAVALVDAQAAMQFIQPSDGSPWYFGPQRILAAHGMDAPKNLGTGAFAKRASFAHMRQQLSFYFLTNTPGAAVAAQSSSVPATVASAVMPASTSPSSVSGVPQYLPVRLNPLPTPSVQQPQAAAVVTTAQIVATQPSGGIEIAHAESGTPINAGSFIVTSQPSPAQGPSFIDVVNNPSEVTINAGGNAGGTIDAGSDRFTITIPKLGIGPIDVISPEDPFSHNGLLAPLQNGLGHLFGNPGGGGKILIYGHSSSYPWDTSAYTKIFRRINELEPGDEVLIEFGGQQRRYQVTFEETVPAKDMSAYQDDGSGEDLILYTCWPPDSISQRYLVHAKPV